MPPTALVNTIWTFDWSPPAAAPCSRVFGREGPRFRYGFGGLARLFFCPNRRQELAVEIGVLTQIVHGHLLRAWPVMIVSTTLLRALCAFESVSGSRPSCRRCRVEERESLASENVAGMDDAKRREDHPGVPFV